MKVVLELSDPNSNIRSITVRHDIVIGRGSDCNLRVSSPQVSRRHCFLRIHSERVTITDLESCNGTWLDGQRTVPGKRYVLEDGMQIAIGPVRFVARVITGAPDVLPAEKPESPQHRSGKAAAAPRESSMNFALEHGGPAAQEDEPTHDYPAALAKEFRLSEESVAIRAGTGSEDLIEVDRADDDSPAPIIPEFLLDDDTIAGEPADIVDDGSRSHDDLDEVIILDDD